jgi:uncharacterized protein (TIGR02466 family)
MPEIRTLFPKLLYTEQLNVSDAYNNEIKQEIIKILERVDTSGPTSVTSYFGGQESAVSILGNPVFAPLVSMIRDNIRSFCQATNFKGGLEIDAIWVSITQPGKYHDVHTHPNVTLAGVYYVETAPSSTLNFVHEGRMGALQDHMEPLSSKKLILFDGSLIHGFTHINTDEPKITISFNCNVFQSLPIPWHGQ